MKEREEKILALIDKKPDLTEKEIAKELYGQDAVQQNVNRDCRALVSVGLVRRIGNGGPSDPFRYQRSGTSVPNDVAEELDHRRAAASLAETPAVRSDQADDPKYDPESVFDNRKRAMRAICMRRGQAAFRNALLAAYGGRCAVTDCNVKDVLEAAHIVPYAGPHSDRVCNGLLLRADIHTLFDCGLLAFEPETRVVVLAGGLRESDYAQFAGCKLREPNNPACRPDAGRLAERLREMSEPPQPRSALGSAVW